MQTKGIVLAGGTGSRLFPATLGLSKQLLHVYDKPMIYYPLATLMSAGIKDFCIIVNKIEVEMFKKLLGDGSQWGIKIEFQIQESPEGIPQAFIIAEAFLDGDNAALILGDNLFIGHGLGRSLSEVITPNGAHIFLYEVEHPENYGVPIFDNNKRILMLTEKPEKPEHNLAIPGLYFFDNSVSDRARNLNKSKRGEYEIVDLLQSYAIEHRLTYTELSRGTAWLDTGSPEDLFNAGEFVRVIQQRQGSFIACLEEIAYRNGWISLDVLTEQQKRMEKSPYGNYLQRIITKSAGK